MPFDEKEAFKRLIKTLQGCPTSYDWVDKILENETKENNIMSIIDRPGVWRVMRHAYRDCPFLVLAYYAGSGELRTTALHVQNPHGTNTHKKSDIRTAEYICALTQWNSWMTGIETKMR